MENDNINPDWRILRLKRISVRFATGRSHPPSATRLYQPGVLAASPTWRTRADEAAAAFSRAIVAESPRLPATQRIPNPLMPFIPRSQVESWPDLA
ncbi:MAG TPA: hypothetical protein VK302_06525 [Terriglobales bacterium]|nr:hypothetical protein [Terriglobales bacterium]